MWEMPSPPTARSQSVRVSELRPGLPLLFVGEVFSMGFENFRSRYFLLVGVGGFVVLVFSSLRCAAVVVPQAPISERVVLWKSLFFDSRKSEIFSHFLFFFFFPFPLSFFYQSVTFRFTESS